ncbi:hypothetical protein E4H12_11835 [Candidatus Thorarchaeota archaeon]|nr:MAG: hypothetical protein E4H12_11835 [Candidatus Thorarchaeota archaeon]
MEKQRKIFKILETLLAIEILLLIYGSATIAYWFPLELIFFYFIIIPLSILITGPLWFIFRKKLKSP